MVAGGLSIPAGTALPDVAVLKSRVADAAGGELLEQPLLDLAGLVDDRLRGLNRLVHPMQNRRDLLLPWEWGERNIDLLEEVGWSCYS